ncbi:hypothetical protein U1Q18_036764 [Sarracenia purpurea var. burkii]
METLNSTEPHYIRCVKPNSLNQPHKFENPSVLHQLRCGGVLEAVRISLAGYPTRRTYPEFVDRFGLVALEIMDRRLFEKFRSFFQLTRKLIGIPLLRGRLRSGIIRLEGLSDHDTAPLQAPPRGGDPHVPSNVRILSECRASPARGI